MSDRGDAFDATLSQLEQERQRAESSYFEALADLRNRLERIRAAADFAERSAREHVEQGGVPTRVQGRPVALPDPLGEGAEIAAPTAVPWPSGRGLRGFINRRLRGLLRDYLEVLDRRHESVAGALAAGGEERRRLAAGIDAGRAPMAALVEEHEFLGRDLDGLAAALGRVNTLVESVRELSQRSGEAFDRLEGLAEGMRLLADAKNAEALRRATEGPVRRMDLLFDAVERRQEALLAELARRVESSRGV